jgi:hypothetical protein
MTTIEIFNYFKFTYRGRCNCNGPKTDKWKRGNYTVYYNKGTKTFRLKHHGVTVSNRLPDTELYATLEEIVHTAFEDAA